MQLHPSAPFGAPNSSLTLTPALESGPPPANNTHFAGVFEQSLCPPPPSPLAPVAAVFLPVRPDPTCATSLPARRACLRVEPTCESNLPARRAYLRVVGVCLPIPVPPASITACPRCCSFPACATRPYLRVEPACASSLPARRAGLPACLHARACARGENVVNLRRTLKFFRRTCNSVAAA